MTPVLYKKTKWLNFYIVERKPKTLVLDVINTSDQHLGQVKWGNEWRQYIYYPADNAYFNNRCLTDIADVLTSLNTEHKETLRAESKGD